MRRGDLRRKHSGTPGNDHVLLMQARLLCCVPEEKGANYVWQSAKWYRLQERTPTR